MKIIYLITLLLLFITFISLKKKEEKSNLIVNTIFAINIMYFANLLLTHILSIINLNANFLTLSVINVFIIVILVFKNIKKYQRIKFQSHILDIRELIFLGLICIACISIGVIRFNNFKQISYETTDPVLHYKTATIYSEQLQLLTKENSIDEIYVNFDHGMTGFYVNCGLLMKIMDNVDGYKVYILFDTFILFLLAATFYVTALQIKKVKKNNLILFLVTLLYCGAYCLNNLVFGFGYLGPGILASNLVLLTWLFIEEEKNDKIKNNYYSLLFIFNYGIFFSYFLFVPVMYLSQGIYIIYKFIKKKYTFKQMLLIGTITLILPFAIGIIYFILPGFLKNGTTPISTSYSGEGYIYRDLWSNFILIMPILIYSIIYFFKNKKFDILITTFIILFLFIIATFIAGLFFGKVSSYYYFKSYYVLWMVMYLIIIRLVNIKDFNVKLMLKTNIYFIVIVVIILLSNVEVKIQQKNILFNNSSVAPGVTNVYWFNTNRITKAEPTLYQEELEIISETGKYYDRCLNNKKEIPLIGGTLQKLWFYSLTDIVPIYNHISGNLSQFYDENFDITSFENDNNSKCLIIFNRANESEEEDYIDINYNKYSILYENEYGSILMKKN